MKDRIITKLDGLSNSHMIELSNYIDYLKYKDKNQELTSREALLEHFRQHGIATWKDLATAIRGANLQVASSGYIYIEKVISWVSVTYSLEEDLAYKAIKALTDSGLLHTSSNGNIA
ncbi:hypothetical protein [Sabulibacter ruber]|uniref:hypothetical protein n=1 Tax=Sabulibacter ruber TaxID=2811901 RepID=UPI001A978619|nr:hypothetical protein [Sabulibacter ruber]